MWPKENVQRGHFFLFFFDPTSSIKWSKYEENIYMSIILNVKGKENMKPYSSNTLGKKKGKGF